MDLQLQRLIIELMKYIFILTLLVLSVNNGFCQALASMELKSTNVTWKEGSWVNESLINVNGFKNDTATIGRYWREASQAFKVDPAFAIAVALDQGKNYPHTLMEVHAEKSQPVEIFLKPLPESETRLVLTQREDGYKIDTQTWTFPVTLSIVDAQTGKSHMQKNIDRTTTSIVLNKAELGKGCQVICLRNKFKNLTANLCL
jgi:hypothetical protein